MDKKGDFTEMFKDILWIAIFALLLLGIYAMFKRFT
jgi:hypothetical protein